MLKDYTTEESLERFSNGVEFIKFIWDERKADLELLDNDDVWKISRVLYDASPIKKEWQAIHKKVEGKRITREQKKLKQIPKSTKKTPEEIQDKRNYDELQKKLKGKYQQKEDNNMSAFDPNLGITLIAGLGMVTGLPALIVLSGILRGQFFFSSEDKGSSAHTKAG